MTVAAVLDPTDLGTDIALTPPESGRRMVLVSGQANLAMALARRFSTELGSLIYDLGYGYNLLGMLNGNMSPARISAAQSQIVAQALLDERVQTARASVAADVATRTLTVEIDLGTALGSFSLVLGVSSLGVQILGGLTLPAGVTAAVLVPSFAGPPGPAGIGPPGPAGPPGPSGGGGGGRGGVPFVMVLENVSNTGGEELLPDYQFTADLTGQAAGTITLDVAALVSSASGTAYLRCYVGGTFGAIDGTLVAQVTIAAGGPTAAVLSGTLTNPTGTRPVKFTLQSSGAGVEAAVMQLAGSLG